MIKATIKHFFLSILNLYYMSKAIFLLFSILVGTSEKSYRTSEQQVDCNKFHEKNLFDLAIYSPLKRKIQTADKYVLEVKAESGVQQIVLLRNNATKELFDYVIENDILSKKAGERELRIARFDSQKNIFVRPFKQYCP